MGFELSVALKYLLPRWRQLSVSIISVISVLVIALVVWLVVVFFSVTHGLEAMWTEKLIALTAPVRITPKEAYYQSYYYKVDSLSAASDYTSKNIRDKLHSQIVDPYDPSMDEQLPTRWPSPDRDEKGEVKDLVKLAWGSIDSIDDVPGLQTRDFEMAAGSLKLRLIREMLDPNQSPLQRAYTTQAFLSQPVYLGSFDGSNPSLSHSLESMSMQDLTNSLKMLTISNDNIQEDAPEGVTYLGPDQGRERLNRFFQFVTITELKTPDYGWKLPRYLLPAHAHFAVVILKDQGGISQVILPPREESVPLLQTLFGDDRIEAFRGKLLIENGVISLSIEGQREPLPTRASLIIPGGTPLPATLHASSIEHAHHSDELTFQAHLKLQGIDLHGEIPLRHLEIGKAHLKHRIAGTPNALPFWAYEVAEPEGTVQRALPSDEVMGEPILLPKNFRESGAMVGDRGFLSYLSPTASSLQEQRIPITVMGFFDPGILPIGGKYILTNPDLTAMIRAAHSQEDTTLSNGINLRFNHLSQADHVKEQLQEKFTESGIDKYWNIETFREYEFTKDLLQQLSSERNIWSLIAGVIIIIACSNIISMLIILVNDKKTEIGILRSMGATSRSIATIFGTCGVVMGLCGSLIGVGIALLTLRNLQTLVDLISRMQGYEAFSPVFYGDQLPNTVSTEALLFVLIATTITSLLAGIVPAMKASLLKPSTILRSE